MIKEHKKKFILKKYLQSPNIMKMLNEACEIERNFLEGIDIQDGVTFKCYIRKENGLWEFVLCSHLGNLIASALDEKINNIEILTIPRLDSSLEFSSKSELERFVASYDYSNHSLVDLKNIKSIHKTKNTLSQDYVLSNIVVDPEKQHSAADQIAILIRNFKKQIIEYQKQYQILWNNTGFVSAIDIQNHINLLRSEALI